MVSRIVPEPPCPACRSNPGTDAEHNGRRKRYKGQQCCWPGYCGSGQARNDRGQWGVNRVHEPEPASDEGAGENEAENAGSNCDK